LHDANYGLFPLCLSSLVRALDGMKSEIIICDFCSNDPPPETWLPKQIDNTRLRLLKMHPWAGFNRGQGLNICAGAAANSFLLFTDADMFFEKIFFIRAIKIVNRGYAYFPVCYGWNSPDLSSGEWRMHGFGTAFIPGLVWEDCKVPEYPRWGGEDDKFYFEVSKRMPVIREKARGLFHQWHHDELHWKNRFAAGKIKQYRYRLLKKLCHYNLIKSQLWKELMLI
jgi:glycosyltransferase involved in cell wall biosynthesis